MAEGSVDVTRIFDAIARTYAEQFSRWMMREGYLAGGSRAVDEPTARLMAEAWFAGATRRIDA